MQVPIWSKSLRSPRAQINHKSLRCTLGYSVLAAWSTIPFGFFACAERAAARSKCALSFSHSRMMRHKQSAANTRVTQRGATDGLDLSSSPRPVNMVSSSISSFFSESSSSFSTSKTTAPPTSERRWIYCIHDTRIRDSGFYSTVFSPVQRRDSHSVVCTRAVLMVKLLIMSLIINTWAQ